jgi:hypothetical protein
MTGPPSAQDVADALALTLEREDASGAPWCPPGDGTALRRWVTDRSGSLGSGIRRAVRLVRLMAIADGRDYIRFLYIRLSALRTRHFRQALEAAAAEGRLPPNVAILSDRGVHLLEPALAAHKGPQETFEIDFAQMPRLAALIDILHNTLGFAVVADMLAPLLRSSIPTGTATEVARALHAALNAWLSDRLESANHILQAQRIRAFVASRGRVAPETIDDEGILLFWIAAMGAGDDERVDGFRLYRSAATAMLRYRQALRDAAAAWHLEESIGQGLETAEALVAIDQVETGFDSWRSPLRALAVPPASRVKWMTKKEQHRLFNYLGGQADEEDADEPDDETGHWNGGLAGDERFDLAFRLTLLRADVFGAAQASIVARLRKHVAADIAVAQAMESIDDASYTTSTAAYAEVSGQLRLECLAALAALMEAGAAEAVILLDHLAGQEAVKSIIGDASGNKADEASTSASKVLSKLIAPALRAAVADPETVPEGAGRKLLLEAVAATRKVGRVGFRREDRADAGMLAALQSGAAAIVETSRELDRLTAALARNAPVGDIPLDRARFLNTFQHIYRAAIVN